MADEPRPGDDPRLAELLRVNAELAAEIRSLSLGRRAAARSGALPPSRRLAKLTNELEAARARLEAMDAELNELRSQRDALLAHKAAQEREIALLRGGFPGLLRRLRARLSRR